MRAGQNLKDRRAVKLLTASKVALLIAPHYDTTILFFVYLFSKLL